STSPSLPPCLPASPYRREMRLPTAVLLLPCLVMSYPDWWMCGTDPIRSFSHTLPSKPPASSAFCRSTDAAGAGQFTGHRNPATVIRIP
ncbi:hypothetical protein PENTCL1PPCAC_20123, partial [Pristionchus entomophagus]